MLEAGAVVNVTSPVSGLTEVTCTYRFYLGKPNFTTIKIATALMAGLLWICKDKLLYPDQVQIGAYKWRFSAPAYHRINQEYIRTVQFFKSGVSHAPEKQLPWNNERILDAWYAEVGGRD